MKTPILIFFGGAFLAIVLSSTTSNVCQDYEISVECGPCDQTCGQPEILCKRVCTPGVTHYCLCKTNYSRISDSNRICVPDKMCPLFLDKNCTTKTTD